jgi:hypothetical protein
MPGQSQVRPDRHPAAAPGLDAEPAGGRRRGDPGSPDHGAAGDLLVAEHGAVHAAARHLGAEPNFDPEARQSPGRRLGKARRETRQQPRTGLDQNDARGGRVDMAEVAGEGRLRKLGERAGEFDPRRPAADDPKSELPAPLDLVEAGLGAFECDEDTASHRRRILDGFEP